VMQGELESHRHGVICRQWRMIVVSRFPESGGPSGPSPHQSTPSGRAHEGLRSFRFSPHDEQSASMPCMPIHVGHDDREASGRQQLLALRTVRRDMEHRPTP
jgi:hypothetical protein